MIVATVLVPTHDHGATLRPAVGSALAQTVEAIEVFIVGDGMPAEAQRVAEELAAADSRVRLFVQPKGARHGEDHRHRALAEAGGEIVCYLSDDDLWLPDHVATMAAALAEADFAHSLPVRCDPAGELGAWVVDLGLAHFRRGLLERSNRVPLSCAGHTLASYRKLADGWSPAPPDLPTDLHMWRKFLSLTECRALATMVPTALHFPDVDRREWAPAARAHELEEWRRRIDGPGFRDDFLPRVWRAVIAEAGRLEEGNLRWRAKREELEARHRDLRAELRTARTSAGPTRSQAEELRLRNAELEEELDAARAEAARTREALAKVSSTLT